MENLSNNRQAWFDRSFNFKDTAMTFHGLIERLRDTPLRLTTKIATLGSNHLTHQHGGKWSIQEHAGHLLDLETLWLGRIDDMVSNKPVMRSADLTNQKTFDANHNGHDLSFILASFTEERRTFVSTCLANEHIAESASAKHPRLNDPMRLIDLMYFVAEHDDHHLASISQIIADTNSVIKGEESYVLGTHRDELWRLGYQHQVWATEAHESWKTAGFTHGQTILDLGCGPGFASRDLAYLVGSSGKVIAVDRSPHFINFVNDIAKLHELPIETRAVDFDNLNLKSESLDGVYCRWALAWLSNPAAIVQKIARSLKPNATFVTHEYFDWKTFQTEPHSEAIKVSLQAILKSFEAAFGDIDIGRRMPAIFESAGMEVISTKPMSKIAFPGDSTWHWPKTFLHIYLPRVVEMGFLSVEGMHSALSDWKKLEETSGAVCFTPQMVEVIGRKLG